MKVLAAHDGAFFEETYNLLNAWLSIVPGNGAHNLRRLALLETNVADLSFLFTLDQGARRLTSAASAAGDRSRRRIRRRSLSTCTSRTSGHTLVLGATGSGKSFLLNFLVTHAQSTTRSPSSSTWGTATESWRRCSTAATWSSACASTTSPSTRSALEPTPEHLHFLHAFVRVLLEGEDGYRLSDAEDREVYEAVENLYVLERSQRRLFTLANLLPRALAADCRSGSRAAGTRSSSTTSTTR